MPRQIAMDNIVFSLQKAGGISVYWYEILKRLCADPRFEVIMLEYDSAKENIFRQQLDVNCKIIRLDSAVPIQLARFMPVKLPAWVRDDAVFHSSYYRWPSRKLKNIVTVHDWIYKIYGHSVKDYLHVKQQIDAIKKADIVACISKSTLNDTSKRVDLTNKEVRVIYNGCSDVYRILPGVEKKQQVLFVGGRQVYKNFDKAVESINLLADKAVSLGIVGAPLNTDEAAMLQNKLPNRYKSYCRVSNEELNMLYNQSIALLYLSEYEGFGIPVAEAMAAGCPVICLNRSSLPEVAGKAGIMLDKADVALVAESINRMTTDGAYYQELIRCGLKQAGRFSWNKTYNRLSELYLSV